MNIQEIIEQVRALPQEDAKKVREAADEVLNRQNQMPDERLDKMLFEAGLLREIKKPITDFAPYQNRQLAEILDGKPISETIVEERG